MIAAFLTAAVACTSSPGEPPVPAGATPAAASSTSVGAAAQSAVPTVDAAVPVPDAVAAPAPARVIAPTIGLDEPLIELGVGPDRTMEVPVDYDDVGWFAEGGRPGGTGPTVLAGHVDSDSGPAVFARLDETAVDDVVTVRASDGSDARYRVTEIVDYPKDRFPTVRVFGASPRDEIRLITCAGIFDDDAGAYDRNLVVYGERVSEG